MKTILPVLAFAFTSVSIAYAAPLREADIGADAKWFAHVDVDAVRASTAGQQFLAEKTNTSCNPLAVFEKETGFDATNALDGVTCYGNGEHDQRVIVFRHHFDNAKLESWLKTKNYETDKINDSTTAYLLPVKLKKHAEAKIIIVFPKNGVVLMGTQSGIISDAIARLNSESVVANIPNEYRQLSVASPFLAGAADVEACRAANPHVPTWNTRATSFAIGFVNSDIKGEIRSEMASPETAQATANMILGYCGAQSGQIPFLKSVTADVSGDKLQVGGTLPVDVILQKIQKLKAHCNQAEAAVE
ncbi:MAG: hypothetical protein LBV12_11325 [Puniceicoccales bacterium]|nr:hypothetical protein [Puniceicoccales bacterium]